MTANSLSDALHEAYVQARDMDASLGERLQAFADAVRRLGPHFQEAVDKLVARLKDQGVGETAPKPGEPMPLFVLPDETGHLVSLDSASRQGAGRHHLPSRILVPLLPHQHARSRRGTRRDRGEGGQIAAIMPDQQHFTAELKAEHDAPFPILTDIDNGYAMSLNLAFWVGDEMQRLMTGAGWDVSRSQGSNTWLLPIPATFVVGTDGEVKSRFLDPDYRKRVAVEDLIAALKSAQ